jgi:hypothetical protein
MYNCMDNTLQTQLDERLGKKVNPTLETAKEELKSIFLESHPLLNRRWQIFSSRQLEQEDWCQWHATMKRKKTEADWDDMNLDDVWVMNLLANTTNEKLKEMMLEVKAPVTEEKLLEASRLFEAVKVCQKGLNEKDQRALRTQEEGKTFKGKCGRCNEVGHKGNKCKRDVKKMNCKTCNHWGHVTGAFFCRGKPDGGGKPDSPKKQQIRKPRGRRTPPPGRGSDRTLTTSNLDSDNGNRQRTRKRTPAGELCTEKGLTISRAVALKYKTPLPWSAT